MEFLDRDTGQIITFTEGHKCEIQTAKYVVLKIKGHPPHNKIEVLVETNGKPVNCIYQGRIHSFQAEKGKPSIPASHYDAYKIHDPVCFKEKEVFRIMCHNIKG